MVSGGARGRSGPAPDPAALRRDRKDDADWQVLPIEGYLGPVPEFPLPAIPVYDIYWQNKERVKEFDEDATAARRDTELELWGVLWAKPQATMWDQLGLKYEVAAYVRAYIESTGSDSNSGLKTAVLRMGAEIGLSLPGMHTLRWKFGEDELAKKRAAAAVSAEDAGSDAEDRWAALSDGR